MHGFFYSRICVITAYKKTFKWAKNQAIAESSSLVGGVSRKLDSYKIFREICFAANCRIFYTPYQFNFQRQRQFSFIDTQKNFN